MNQEAIIEILTDLDNKYHFTEEEVTRINECLYGDIDEDMKGVEYAEEDEYTDEYTDEE